MDRNPREVVGARVHEEHWIPAEDLVGLNDAIVGEIEVIASFGRTADAPTLAVLAAARGMLDPVGLASVVRRIAAWSSCSHPGWMRTMSPAADRSVLMVGAEGFEPSNAGVKGPCLTA